MATQSSVVNGVPWNSDAILQTLHSFQTQGLFCDTSIISADGDVTMAHACVLAAAAPALQQTLLTSGTPTPVFEINASSSSREIQQLLKAVYTGKHDDDVKEFDSVLQLVSDLGIILKSDNDNPTVQDASTQVEETLVVERKVQDVQVGELCGISVKEEQEDMQMLDAMIGGSNDKSWPTTAEDKLQAAVTATDFPELGESHPSSFEPTMSNQAKETSSKKRKSKPLSRKTKGTSRSLRKRNQCQYCGKHLPKLMKDSHKCKHGRECPSNCEICKKSSKAGGKIPPRKTRGRQKAATSEFTPAEESESNIPDAGTVKFEVDVEVLPASEDIQEIVVDFEEETKTFEKTKTSSKQCEICQKVFSSARMCQLHEYAHSGERPFKCELCDKCYTYPSALRRHKKVAHSNGEKPFHCQYCEKGFTDRRSVVKHEHSVHTGETIYRLDRCDMKFNTALKLSNHKLRIHEGRYRFYCDLCHKGFMSTVEKTRHEQLHTGEKPHICVLCGLTFANVGYLKAHEVRHSDVRKFSCRICGKLYKSAKGRYGHEATHSGETKHTCEVCGTMFKYASGLYNHRWVHKKEKALQCEHCDAKFGLPCRLRKHMKQKHKIGASKKHSHEKDNVIEESILAF